MKILYNCQLKLGWVYALLSGQKYMTLRVSD